MTRRGPSTVTVHVDVDVDDVLSQASAEQLRVALREQEVDEGGSIKDLIDMIEPLLRAGEINDALMIMKRWRNPKFGSVIECAKAFEKARGGHKTEACAA